jgi:hypothetical protein
MTEYCDTSEQHITNVEHDEYSTRIASTGMIEFKWRSSDNTSGYFISDPWWTPYTTWIDFLDGNCQYIEFCGGTGYFERKGDQLHMSSGPHCMGDDVQAWISVDFKRASDVLRIVIEDLKHREHWS